MNFKKISMLGLTACALLFTSCGAKETPYEDAVKHVKENYTGSPTKSFKKFTTITEGKAANDASRDYLKTTYKLDDSLYKKEEVTEGFANICTPEMLATYKAGGYKFYLNGKELTTKMSGEITLGGQKASVESSYTWNSEGYSKEWIQKSVIKASEIDCSVVITMTWEY